MTLRPVRVHGVATILPLLRETPLSLFPLLSFSFFASASFEFLVPLVTLIALLLFPGHQFGGTSAILLRTVFSSTTPPEASTYTRRVSNALIFL